MRVLIFALSLLLAACGSKDENEQPNPYGGKTSDQATEAAAHTDFYADVPLASATVNNLAAGVNYVVMPEPLPTEAPAGKIEVIEVFWYGCPHCNRFQPYVHDWQQRMDEEVVYFKQVPAPLNATWEIHARTFYTAQALNVLDRSHAAVFNAIHNERQALFSKGRIADYFTKFGVEADQFEQVFDSFGVNARINSAKNTLAQWQINGVPMMLVNGKYKIDTRSAGSEANMIKILELLIEREKLLLP